MPFYVMKVDSSISRTGVEDIFTTLATFNISFAEYHESSDGTQIENYCHN